MPHFLRDLPSARDHQDAILRRLMAGRPALFLDYDGTLTPIVPDPALAILPEETRTVLRRLARQCPVAVISGRDLRDVRALVGVEGIAYAGSHGFDILLPDGRTDRERGARFLPDLARAEAALKDAVRDLPGAWVERKQFAVATHFRQMADALVPQLEARFQAVATRAPALRRSTGKRVLELRPDIDWDKGKAVLAIMEGVGLDAGTATPLFIGDDATDEDAMRAVAPRGVNIVVLGEEDRLTLAEYSLGDPAEVKEFLAALSDALQNRDR